MADIVFSAAGRTAIAAHIAGGVNIFGAGSKLVLGTGQYTPDGTETGVSSAFSPAREYAIAGVVSSSTRFTLGFVESNLTEVWNAGEIAIHGTNGTFYGIVSQEAADGWLVPKVAGSHAEWAAEVTLDNGTTANISFTLDYSFPDATAATAGKVFLATGLSDTRGNATPSASQVKAETDDIRNDFAAADTALGTRISGNDTDISALSGRVGTNETNIAGKQDEITGAPGTIYYTDDDTQPAGLSDDDWWIEFE